MTNAGGRADGRDRKGLGKELAAVLDLGGQSSPRGQMGRNRRPVQRCGGVRCPADGPRHEAGHSCVEALLLRELPRWPGWPAHQRRPCPTRSENASAAVNYQELGLPHKTVPRGLPPGSG